VTFTLVACVALTVSVDELPSVIVLESALMLTVAGAELTVIVVWAVALPLPFVAVAI
jgi:hypothetical protein